MDSTIKSLICKKWKESELELGVGRHNVDETFVVTLVGSVEKHPDQFCQPTVSIPLISTLAFVFERLSVDRDSTVSILREAITEAMKAKVNEDSAITARMEHVQESIDVVKRDILQHLPKMRRSGRTDVSDLRITMNALQPVSEPLFSIA
jgi:hypothetical protein